jgi:osmoprotectant transport system permease protein
MIFAAPFVVVAALTAAGALDQIAFAREWVFVRDVFAREFRRHLAYSLGATGGAVLIGVPLGVLAARRRGAETAIMGTLNVGQVLPALAFVGVMMPVLGALAEAVPPLRTLGVAGIGWAPVLVVLLVYALFPVTRNTAAAIKQLDPAVLDAARGMGMTRRRQLFEVELPLAFPVVLAGIRIALVQTTAGAIVAAFVGGGGLGAIMFVGLEQTSTDLVLLGVGPIVALALVFDAALRGIERLSPVTEVRVA